MCCLAYEEDFYRLRSDVLPRAGSTVERDGKQFEVLKVDLMNESFSLRDETGAEVVLSMNEFEGYRTIKPSDLQPACSCGECPAAADGVAETELTISFSVPDYSEKPASDDAAGGSVARESEE